MSIIDVAKEFSGLPVDDIELARTILAKMPGGEFMTLLNASRALLYAQTNFDKVLASYNIEKG